jgi:membrane fusion protein (multidrug efflux system)
LFPARRAGAAACQKAPKAASGFPPAQVTTIVVQPRTLPVTYEYVGQTAGVKEVEVRARVTGILEKRLFNEGAWVKAGETLFTIDPKPLQAQAAAAEAEVARARALVAQADREVAQLKPLAERKAVGQKEADDAVSNAELARAGLQAAQAKLAEVNLNLGYTKVTSLITDSPAAPASPKAACQRERDAADARRSRPDLDPVPHLGERAAETLARRGRRQARAAQGECL